MTTRSLTLVKDDDWAPVVAVTGDLVIRRYRVSAPLISGNVTIDGTIGIRIPRPRKVAPQAGQFTVQGRLAAGVKAPAAAFKDFAHYPFGGTDPAMAWIGVNSGTLKSAVAGSYSRPYTAFTGPVDYPVSGSGYAWKRAAYAAVGFKFASMSANKHQLLDAVQFEPLPLAAAGPSAYQNAREIQAVIKPTRLNYASNPNYESGITGAAATNGASVAADAFCWRGTQSCKVTVPTSVTQDAGYNFQVSGLIPGRRYTMSTRISVAQNCGNVYAWSSGTGSQQVARSYFSASKPDPAQPRWRVVWVTFDATATSVWIGFNVSKSTMVAGQPSIFWADAVLIEEGTAIRPYFDGSMGSDYLWEQGGSANLSRSYFYEDYVERSYLIRTLLAENVPLGITTAVPQYAVLPIQ
jgi:hypothetical protein